MGSKNTTPKTTNKKIVRKKTRGSTHSKNRLKNEIIGIIYIVMALLFFVSNHYGSGLIFEYLIMALKAVSGKGHLFIPYFLGLTGLAYLADFLKKSNQIRIVYFFMAFISILTLLTVSDKTVIASGIYKSRTLSEVANYFLSAGLDSPAVGGGIIGGLFSFLLVLLLGRAGTIVVGVSVILISLIIITDKSMVLTSNKIFKKIYAGFKKIMTTIYDFIFIEEKSKGISKKSKRDNQANQSNLANNGEDVLYHDYSIKNEINRKKLIDMDIDTPKKINEQVSFKTSKDFQNSEETFSVKIKKEKDRTQDETNQVINSSGVPVDDKYVLPNIQLLDRKKNNNLINEKKEAIESADILLKTLKDFGIDCKLVQINRGPTITRYELQPAPGVKVSRITNLSKDIALSLAKSDLRIEAPIPGKAAIGIEVPNNEKSNVFLSELFESPEYNKQGIAIPFVVGKDIAGKNIVADITGMPHLLIAGATGSGKSVCINSLLMSILFKSKPHEVKLILIDPKVVELNIYNGIPHLLIPVVTDARKAANALNWAVSEMGNRYEIFAKNSVRDINSYNIKKARENPEEVIPKIVIIIDELADLMMVAASDVEDSITRLAQLARAAGIHLVIATQRPSVDVITGTIKANIPSRIAFAVSSYIDSRTILDMSGAEKLLGKGDLLYHPMGLSKPLRIQGAFVSDDEVKRVIEFIHQQGHENHTEQTENEIINTPSENSNDYDELLYKAASLVVIEGQASVSYMQRKLKVGYSRAARIIDQLEELSIVGPHEGSKPRRVLIDAEELEKIIF
ncbi:MAG: DNA translocase FtsK [Tissierellales bacterium]|nr:DNA translocase FtsK [Tissierellales bacterium]MBN2828311.1 DNA translocase FtsK [Tissierellales bacterium]